MNLYIRAASVAALILIYSLLGYLYWTSSSTGGDERALSLFKEGNLKLAHAFIEELERSSSTAKYPLYHAYVLRAQGDLEQSEMRLQKALDRGQDGSSKLRFEIHLNRALNAFLRDDLHELELIVKNLNSIKTVDPAWVAFFEGVLAYEKGNFIQSQPLLSRLRDARNLSPWMRLTFDQHFTPFWLKCRLIRCRIEEGMFLAVRHQLEEELASTANQSEKDRMQFLMGMTYFTEAQSKSSENAMPYLRLAFGYFERCQEPDLFKKEWREIASFLEGHLNNLSQNEMALAAPFYLGMLEAIYPYLDQEHFAASLLRLIDDAFEKGWEAEAKELAYRAAQGPFKKSLQKQMDQAIERALAASDPAYVEKRWRLASVLHDQELNFNRAVADRVRFQALRVLVEDDSQLKETLPFLVLWNTLENDPKQRLIFATTLVQEGQRIWQGQRRYDKAINVFKLAERICYQNERRQIHTMIEETVARIHKRAVNEDQVSQYFFILDTVQELNLTEVQIFDRQEMEHQLADADYFFKKQRYHEAQEKALWVLQLEPTNQKALKILGLIAFEERQYGRASNYLGQIKAPDAVIVEALKSSQVALERVR